VFLTHIFARRKLFLLIFVAKFYAMGVKYFFYEFFNKQTFDFLLLYCRTSIAVREMRLVIIVCQKDNENIFSILLFKELAAFCLRERVEQSCGAVGKIFQINSEKAAAKQTHCDTIN
jgi:hypothetical protein